MANEKKHLESTVKECEQNKKTSTLVLEPNQIFDLELKLTSKSLS